MNSVSLPKYFMLVGTNFIESANRRRIGDRSIQCPHSRCKLEMGCWRFDSNNSVSTGRCLIFIYLMSSESGYLGCTAKLFESSDKVT
ncbi:MAG: hypothetical protein E6Q34_02820 [Burkholderiaceae bacterium]|nr:MAG: hypothetical protein E6Q34_02820 [Burkholderiaceae bacterium]